MFSKTLQIIQTKTKQSKTYKLITYRQENLSSSHTYLLVGYTYPVRTGSQLTNYPVHSRTLRLEAGGFPSETGHMVDSWYTPCSKQGFEEHSRTMLPLTTVWAFTIWKSQGQTFSGKVVLNIRDHER
eukprot:scaffold19111_cov30-Attheya_sp.AAC.1